MEPKVDVTKVLPSYRARRGRFDLVDVPDLQYLMVDGRGDPNTSPDFPAAVQTLYPLAYTLKAVGRREHGRDHVVPPLEGLWWAADLDVFTRTRDKSDWLWTLMVLVPDWLGADDVAAATDQVRAKAPPRLDDVRLGTLREGRCVQTLHVGPYDDEAPVLAELHEVFLPAHGLRPTGTHHEVYLGDHRRVAPERMRTILRQPVS